MKRGYLVKVEGSEDEPMYVLAKGPRSAALRACDGMTSFVSYERLKVTSLVDGQTLDSWGVKTTTFNVHWERKVTSATVSK